MSQTLSSRLNVGVAQIVVPGTSSGLVAAAGLPGNTTGTAIAAGYVGEVLTASLSNVAAPSGSVTNAGSITLTAGQWLVYGKSCLTWATAPTTFTQMRVSVSTTSATENLVNAVGGPYNFASSPGSNFFVGTAVLPISTTGTTVYLVGIASYTGGGTVIYNGTQSTFFAVRIA